MVSFRKESKMTKFLMKISRLRNGLNNDHPCTHHVDCTANILLHTIYQITIHLSIPLSMHQSMSFSDGLRVKANLRTSEHLTLTSYYSMQIID